MQLGYSSIITNTFTGYSHVTAYSDLPPAAEHTNEYWIVDTTTGVILINQKKAGFYKSDGTNWNYIGAAVDVTSLSDGTTPVTGTPVKLIGSNGVTITSNVGNTALNVSGNDNTVVHLTGNESISGVKTFTNGIALSTPLPISSGGTGTSSFTTGSIPFMGSSGFLQDNINFYWDDANKRVGIGTSSPTSQLTQKSTTALESATLGAELLTPTGWTSTGWTGSFATGFTHTTGNTTSLSATITPTISNLYQIAFTVTGRTAGSFTITFGGITSGAYTATNTYGPKAISTGTLSITPTTDFNGTIVISVKQITGSYAATYAIQDSTGSNSFEVRNGLASRNSTFVGLGAGRYNTTGNNNCAIGYLSLGTNTTGGSNSAQGYASLYYNTTGNNNTTQGYASLYYNITGNNNTAQGYTSLYSNTTGSYNSAQGYQSLLSNTTGNYNTAQGYGSLYYNTTGGGNTAQGSSSLNANTTGSNNCAIGSSSLSANTTGNFNSAQGSSSLNTNTTGSYNSAIGYNAGRYIADGATGRTTGDSGLYLGYNTKASADGTTNEIVVGYNAIGKGSNTAVYGNTSMTKHVFEAGNIGIGTTAPTAKLHINSDIMRLETAKTPASSTATGNTGDICWDANYIYVCIATNTWKRSAISTW